MAKSANLYARIEPEVKEQAERILSALGIPASNAINMFYKQIILQKGLPFEVKIPDRKPLDINTLSEESINTELEKGYAGYESRPYKRRKNCFCRNPQRLWRMMFKAETSEQAETDLREIFNIYRFCRS